LSFAHRLRHWWADQARPAHTNRAARGIDGPIRALVDVPVRPIDQTRSRVAIDIDFEGHRIGKILLPLLVRRQAAKEMSENLARASRTAWNRTP
jgi:hypothetical protein